MGTLERQACVEYRLLLVSRREAPLRDCGCYREEVSGSVQSRGVVDLEALKKGRKGLYETNGQGHNSESHQDS